MRIKVEKLLGTGEESYIWMLCTETSQICGGPVFLKASDAIAHAEEFVRMFNNPEIQIENTAPPPAPVPVLIKKGFQLLAGGKD